MSDFDTCPKCGIIGDLEGHACVATNNNLSLNEHLALKVMGWKKIESQDHKGRFTWHRISDDIFMLWDGEWNPPENIEQAMMCASQFRKDGVEIFMGDGESECCIGETLLDGGISGTEYKGRAICDFNALPEAISLACGQASGFEDKS